MAQSVGALRVEMEAAQARFERDLAKARKNTKRFNSSAQKGFKRTNKASSDMTRAIKRSASAILFIAGPAVIGLFVKASITAAGDAAEAWSKFDAVFKDQAATTREWALDFAAAVGRSKTEVASWLSTLQDTFVPMGLARDEAAGLAKDLVKLAVDLGSFNDIADDQVILDFQSALVGNTETVRKYGIVINESNTKQEAYSSGIAKAGEKLTEQQKILARYNLILAGTTDAQGDALRTSDSYNNKVKKLNSQIQSLSETLGEKFLPAANDAVTAMGKLVETTDLFLQSEDKAGIALKVLTVLMQSASEASGILAALELQRLLAEDVALRSNTKAREENLQAQLSQQKLAKIIAEGSGQSVAAIDLEILRLEGLIDKKEENSQATKDAVDEEAKAREKEKELNKEAEFWIGRYNAALHEAAQNKIPSVSAAYITMAEIIKEANREIEESEGFMISAGDVAVLVGNLISTAFAAPANKGEKFKNFILGFLNLMEAAILASSAANKAIGAIFAGPFGIGVLVASLVAIEAVKSGVSNMKFAEGGRFVVGGSGGVDTNQVSFAATKGEEVMVRTPAQVAAGVGVGGGGQNILNLDITFEGISPEGFIRETVIPMIEDAARRGATDIITTKNIADGSDLNGGLLRTGKS